MTGAFEVEAIAPDSVTLTRDGWLSLPDGSRQHLRVRKRLSVDGDRRAPRLGLEVVVTNTGEASMEALAGRGVGR